MNLLFHYSKVYIVFAAIFFSGCNANTNLYYPEILAIKNYQSTRVIDEKIYINGSFAVSPPPEGRTQLEQLAKIVTNQAKHVFGQYASQYKRVLLEYQIYKKTEVINEDFTDIYDSGRSIAISPDSGEVPLTLNDVGKNVKLVSIRASKTSNQSDTGCRFRLETKIYHHYWIFGSRKEQFINKVMDMPCSEWHGWE